ncbi:MAG: glycosyltransferase [Candidatus Aenigmarchaeota archaeon]|nr:glycosyltransferase [Candidatus Aenigmarchaeota archaeon]
MDVWISKFGPGSEIASGVDTVPLQHWKHLSHYGQHNDEMKMITGLNLYTEDKPFDWAGYTVFKRNGHGDQTERYEQLDHLITSLTYESKPRLFHTHTRGRRIIELAKRNKKTGGKHIHTMHGMDSLYDPMDRELFNDADLITAPSEYVSNLIRGLDNGKYSNKVLTLPNSTDYGIYNRDHDVLRRAQDIRLKYAPDGSRLVLTTGRLEEDKGIFELGEAVAELVKSGEQLKLMHAGMIYNPQNQERLVQIFADRGVLDNLIMLGKIEPSTDPKGLPSIYKAADMFVMPSDTKNETFCMSALEALSLGTPIIVSNEGGMKEVYVDPHVAIGVSPRNTKQIQEAIDIVNRNYEQEKQRAEIGRQYIEEMYDSRVITGLLYRIYEKLYREIPVVPTIPRNLAMPEALQKLHQWLKG